MMRWGDEKTLFFIICYREYECLWNPASSLYKNQEARQNAYTCLLEQFNDDNLTVKQLKTKIKNIRTTYHQELHKVRHSKLSGGAHAYKPTLYWFEALDAFLGEIQKETKTSTTPSPTTTTHTFKRELHSTSRLEFSAQTSSVNNLQSNRKRQRAHSDLESTPRKQTKPNTQKFMKRPYNETDLEICDASSQAASVEDEFHFFGMNVAAQLRRLPMHVALQLQTQFQNTLYLARVQVENSSSEVTAIQSDEESSEGETIEHYEDENVSPPSIRRVRHTIELPFEGQLPRVTKVKGNVFKKAWESS